MFTFYVCANDVITELCSSFHSFSCTDDRNVTVDMPTPPTGQQDEHVSVPVVIGKYFYLKLALFPSFNTYCTLYTGVPAVAYFNHHVQSAVTQNFH